MKLLIVTQIYDKNDPVLGFFHEWVRTFSRHTDIEAVKVVCLLEGQHTPSSRIDVYSLGKESFVSRVRYLYRFYTYMWRMRKEYDAVFVHMIPLYVVIGGLVWRMLGKRVGFWYAHGTTSLMLRIAAILSHAVYTSTPEGFRLSSSKKNVVGQGIDTDVFSYAPSKQKIVERLVSVGRISRSKDIMTLIKAFETVSATHPRMSLTLIGDTVTEADRVYKNMLEEYITEKGIEDRVVFEGPVSHEDLPKALERHDLFIHAGATGSLDKVLLEALSTGLLALSSNDAYPSVLGEHAPLLTFSSGSHEELAQCIEKVISMTPKEREDSREDLRGRVEKDHSLDRLIHTIVETY